MTSINIEAYLNILFASLVGFHFGLVLYEGAKHTADPVLHLLIFFSGFFTILLFAVTKELFENRLCFLVSILMFATVFNSCIVLSVITTFFKKMYNWLVLVVYNIASTRSMKLVDISVAAKRNIIFNTLALLLNLAYELA